MLFFSYGSVTKMVVVFLFRITISLDCCSVHASIPSFRPQECVSNRLECQLLPEPHQVSISILICIKTHHCCIPVGWKTHIIILYTSNSKKNRFSEYYTLSHSQWSPDQEMKKTHHSESHLYPTEKNSCFWFMFQFCGRNPYIISHS